MKLKQLFDVLSEDEKKQLVKIAMKWKNESDYTPVLKWIAEKKPSARLCNILEEKIQEDYVFIEDYPLSYSQLKGIRRMGNGTITEFLRLRNNP